MSYVYFFLTSGFFKLNEEHHRKGYRSWCQALRDISTEWSSDSFSRTRLCSQVDGREDGGGETRGCEHVCVVPRDKRAHLSAAVLTLLCQVPRSPRTAVCVGLKPAAAVKSQSIAFSARRRGQL